jgi:two-component system cell cycle sensor histidine kinase/response regulator CckA
VKRRGLDETVQALLAATSASVGPVFFEELARTTAESLGMRWALVGELRSDDRSVKTLAAWDTSQFLPALEYPLDDTPCQNVTWRGACQYVADVAEQFPRDALLVELGAVSYAGIAIPGPRGRPIGVLAALHDAPIEPFTDLQARLGVFAIRAGMEINRLRVEQELLRAQKMELLGQLAGGVVHDLNNLITPLVGLGSMLAADLANTRHETIAQDLYQAGSRASTMLRSLLAFARSDPSLANCDASNVAIEFEGLLRRTIPAGITFEVIAAPESLPIPLETTELEQMILNLVINACDACGGQGHVTVRCRRGEDSAVLIQVEDDGPGVPPKLAEEIFEPFVTTKPVGKGTGLGLASVRTVATRAGGHVTVEPGPQRGAVFTIWLPALESARSVVPRSQRRVAS